MGSLRDLCPPAEEPKEERANRTTLGLSVSGRRDCGRFAKGRMFLGQAGLRCSVVWQFSDWGLRIVGGDSEGT